MFDLEFLFRNVTNFQPKSVVWPISSKLPNNGIVVAMLVRKFCMNLYNNTAVQCQKGASDIFKSQSHILEHVPSYLVLNNTVQLLNWLEMTQLKGATDNGFVLTKRSNSE